MYGILPSIKTASGEEIQGYPVEILNPPKVAILRLPTSDELIAYSSAQRNIVTDLGRNKTQTEEAQTPVATEKLFRAIRLDKGEGVVEFDETEMQKAIGMITRHRIISITRDGLTYVVKLATLFDDQGKDGKLIPTVHTIEIPREKDAADYRRAAYVSTDLPNNRTEQRFPIEAEVRLYDKTMRIVDGYASLGLISGVDAAASIPPHHKRTVIRAVMGALADLDPGIDPNY